MSADDEPGVCRQCGLENIPAGGGGAGTERARYPWLVEIQSPAQPRCQGTLISSRYVVTAGHCLVKWLDWDNRNKFIKLLKPSDVKVVFLAFLKISQTIRQDITLVSETQ